MRGRLRSNLTCVEHAARRFPGAGSGTPGGVAAVEVFSDKESSPNRVGRRLAASDPLPCGNTRVRWYAETLAKTPKTLAFPLKSSDYDSIVGGMFPMEKDTTITRTPPSPKAPQHTDAPPVRILPIDEVKRLIRKVSKDHEGLFRRLAK